LEALDKISAELLKNVNVSLPERADVRKHSPEFLNKMYSRELHLNEDPEVWITYVHTGAGYRNVIGYYWYKDGEKTTDLMDVSLLGSDDDQSVPGQNRYFVSKRGFNWALHIPPSVGYTSEKVDFTKASLRFADWVKSGGQQYPNWYMDTDGHINKRALFNR
jgi:hypothetical protein